MSSTKRTFDPQNAKRKRMRGVIIHHLCLLGYVCDDGSPDFDRINACVKKLGNNKRGVILNYLYLSELPDVVTQVKELYKKESKKMRNMEAKSDQ